MTEVTEGAVGSGDAEESPNSEPKATRTVRSIAGGALDTGACCLEGCGCLASLGFAVVILVASIAFATTQFVQSVYASVP